LAKKIDIIKEEDDKIVSLINRTVEYISNFLYFVFVIVSIISVYLFFVREIL